MSYRYTIIEEGKNFFATADDQERFYVGTRTQYEGLIGLFNLTSKLPNLDFDAANFRSKFEFWSDFIEPTAYCEGRNFLTLNTYDTAAFTFGFGQFAAHVPNGDFVCYFRNLLTFNDAGDYFPELTLRDGRIHAAALPIGESELENDKSTKALMAYLNPTLHAVEHEEVLAAAKFIHWTHASVDARNAQVSQMIETYRGFMEAAMKKVDMDHRPATQCCVMADILHHGRGGKKAWSKIKAALANADPFSALIAIGNPKWAERTAKLRRHIEANPEFAGKHWGNAKRDFV